MIQKQSIRNLLLIALLAQLQQPQKHMMASAWTFGTTSKGCNGAVSLHRRTTSYFTPLNTPRSTTATGPLQATNAPSSSSSSSSAASNKNGMIVPPAAPDTRYYTVMETFPTTQSGSAARITLTRYLEEVVQQNPELRDLHSLLSAVQMACKTISSLVNRAGLVYSVEEKNDFTDGRFYSMKRLDQLSTLVLKNALKFTGKCEVVAPSRRTGNSSTTAVDGGGGAAAASDDSPAQHQPGVLIAKSLDSNYVACLDPLDGSGNADASICTGTVFGVFQQQKDDNHEEENNNNNNNNSAERSSNAKQEQEKDRTEQLVQSVLQPAKNMRAAGYCLYSSATVLVFSLGETVQGFTLDPQTREFVLTHPDLTIPARGTVYSCNEANSEGWTEGYKQYLRSLKMGTGETGQRYAHRYVGSMVGDIHRTLLYGGIFCYPSDTLTHPDGNLQLLYKTAPMAFVVHRAGGKAIDGRSGSLLDVRPERVHQKTPCFMGSPDDVSELEQYLTE